MNKHIKDKNLIYAGDTIKVGVKMTKSMYYNPNKLLSYNRILNCVLGQKYWEILCF